MDTALVNEVTYKVKWERPRVADEEPGTCGKGPVGEYLEVVDYDPASKCFYAPVDLNDHLLLAQDGLAPSEGNPQFHQQMVYAAAMTTIQNFERSLGRFALWSPRLPKNASGEIEEEQYVGQLRIYPHALREANAYYSPEKKAILFGYFPASADKPGDHFPGGVVFTCLSHDIIAHETTHALLDGMHRRFVEPTNADVRAFHEAFADIVALFQHFSFPEVLRHQIAKTRGNLASQNLLGELAQQFGKATGPYGALRSAIGEVNPNTGKWELKPPEPRDMQTMFEPHDRGAILVAAVFDAFLSIYSSRVADLFRIASNGTGVMPDGALHPDLVVRLADEAAKSAQHILNMCIRALDYCPPVDITFGEYLRAIITADFEMVAEDDRGYRVAFIEAFRRRGIYPHDVRTLSVDSLRWPTTREEEYDADLRAMIGRISQRVKDFTKDDTYIRTREEAFTKAQELRASLHKDLYNLLPDFEHKKQMELTGLVLARSGENLPFPSTEFDFDKNKRPKFELHSLRSAQQVGPDGKQVNNTVLSITQKRKIPMPERPPMIFRGGCTLILDLNTSELRYRIVKRIDDELRLTKQKAYMNNGTGSLRATYFGDDGGNEPFAALHRDYEGGGLL
jgi:hypothetical protein